MVKEYLEKMKESYINRRIELLKELTTLENLYKKNIKMIQLLEENDDSTIDSFTPRQINKYNRNKITELEQEQKDIDAKVQSLHNVISEMDCKIDEITSVIKVAREDIVSPDSIEEIELEPDMNMLILESVEGERQRIARDLHDSSVQSLTSLVHKSELCMKLLDIDPIRCRLELSSMSKILRDVINDMRKMIYDLRPMSFDDIGFDITVERALDKFKQANNVHIVYKVEGEPYELKSIVSITLLRVIQETCSNSVKHGKASTINITMEFLHNELKLVIEDDGVGFDKSTIPTVTRNDNSGFGLSMMKERIYLLSGKLSIESSVGNGCKTTVNLPIKKEDK